MVTVVEKLTSVAASGKVGGHSEAAGTVYETEVSVPAVEKVSSIASSKRDSASEHADTDANTGGESAGAEKLEGRRRV